MILVYDMSNGESVETLGEPPRREEILPRTPCDAPAAPVTALREVELGEGEPLRHDPWIVSALLERIDQRID